jgi:hypothetical protein
MIPRFVETQLDLYVRIPLPVTILSIGFPDTMQVRDERSSQFIVWRVRGRTVRWRKMDVDLKLILDVDLSH